MRRTAIIVATLSLGMGAVACRPYKGAPAGPAAAVDDPVRPSGVGTRTFFKLPNGLGVVLADVVRVARRIIDPRREVLAVVRPRDGERTTSLGVGARPGAEARVVVNR